MPRPRLDDIKRQNFIKLLQEGHTIAEASRQAEISYASGRRIHANLADYVAQTPVKRERLLVPPHPLERNELTPIALDCLNDFGRYRARFFGRRSSPWQEDAAEITRLRIETPFKEFGVVNCPPGSGKSTLFTHDIPAWLSCRSRTLRGFIGSSTQTLANSYVGRLRSTFERTIPTQAKSEDLARGLAVDAASTLAADYGLFRPNDIGIPWSKSQFTIVQFGETLTDEKESTWTAFGRDTGFLGWRVHFVVWDDLVTKARLRTMETIEADRSWWIDEAESRLEPGGLLLLQGQRLGPEDLYRYNLDQLTGYEELEDHFFEYGEEVLPTQKKYFHIVYKAHHEEVCRVHEDPRQHSFKADPYDPADPENGGCLLDPRRLPWRELLAIQARPLSNYRTVYQQEDVNPEEVLVPKVWIDGGTDMDGNECLGCWDDTRSIAQVPKNLSGSKLSVISVDPSPTKFWSIQWWLYNEPTEVPRLMGTRYLLDMHRGPMKAPDFLDFNLDLNTWTGLLVDWCDRAKYLGCPIQYLVFEKNAAQQFLLQYEWFRRFTASRNLVIRPHNTGRNKTDEEFGVTTIRNHYRFGRVRLPGTPEGRRVVGPLVTELTRYPDSSTDDCVMADWMFEYQLQFMVAATNPLPSLYNDIPKWMGQSSTPPGLASLMKNYSQVGHQVGQDAGH